MSFLDNIRDRLMGESGQGYDDYDRGYDDYDDQWEIGRAHV